MELSKNTLSTIKKLIDTLDIEACGFLVEQKNSELQLYIDSYGETKDGRGSCQHSKYTKYIWHTHPHNLIAYPSPEDILKIIKKREDSNPMISVVFTIWGTWTLFSMKKVNLDKAWITYFIEKIKIPSHILYKLTERGRGKYNLNDIEKFILSVQQIINNKLNIGLEIKFFPWN